MLSAVQRRMFSYPCDPTTWFLVHVLLEINCDELVSTRLGHNSTSGIVVSLDEMICINSGEVPPLCIPRTMNEWSPQCMISARLVLGETLTLTKSHPPFGLPSSPVIIAY